jgi:hypothetical protein
MQVQAGEHAAAAARMCRLDSGKPITGWGGSFFFSERIQWFSNSLVAKLFWDDELVAAHAQKQAIIRVLHVVCLCCLCLRVSCKQACYVTRSFDCAEMFSLLEAVAAGPVIPDVNTINTWAEPHNANGVTPNTVIDSNDEPPANNQQRMAARGY